MEDELECEICSDIFEEVVETPCCSRLYCRSCVEQWLQRGEDGMSSCPACRQPLRAEQLRANRPIQRIIDNLPIDCPHKEQGCTATLLTRGCLKDHLKACEWEEVSCSLLPEECETMLRKELAQHVAESCPARPSPCPHCSLNVPFRSLQEHIESECHAVMIECEKCNTSLQRGQMEQHSQQTCPAVEVPCPYFPLGCKLNILRGDLDEHMKENMEEHCRLSIAKVERRNKENHMLMEKIHAVQTELMEYRELIAHLATLRPLLPHAPLGSLPLILPSRLAKPHNCPEFQLYNSDLSFTFQYGGGFFAKNSRKERALMIRSDVPIPALRSCILQHAEELALFYYFEITVDSAPKDCAIGLGLCPVNHSGLGMPGWDGGSFGYHSDDGKKFSHETGGFGHPFGPLYGKGDVIGCGWNMTTGKLYYTKNGGFIGFAFEGVHPSDDSSSSGFYPVIGLHTGGVKLTVNFGQSPFAYDWRRRKGQQQLVTNKLEEAAEEAEKEKENEGANNEENKASEEDIGEKEKEKDSVALEYSLD
ncbi:Ran-binding protein 9 [Balamuthia mandrillaris]